MANGYRAAGSAPAKEREAALAPKIDARGWIGIAVFILTVMVLWMIAKIPELRHDEFFKVIATAIVLTGFVNGIVNWGFSSTKQGGELAATNAAIVEQTATTAPQTNGNLGDQVEDGARAGTKAGVTEALNGRTDEGAEILS